MARGSQRFEVRLAHHIVMLSALGRLIVRHVATKDTMRRVTGATLFELVSADGGCAREPLRALDDACAQGEDDASESTLGFWQDSRRIVRNAIVLMQGDAGAWCDAVAEHLPNGLAGLPQWPRQELASKGKIGDLQSVLRSWYRLGGTPEEAARALLDCIEMRDSQREAA